MPATRNVFMFSGQGSQFFGMGRQLFDTNARFRDWMLRLDTLAYRLSGLHVVDAIHAKDKSETFNTTSLTHPAIFLVEYALAQCLIESGVRPDLTLGASLGAFAAAGVAGHLDAETAMAAVIAQARAFEATCEPGGMIAVLAPPSLYEEEAFLRTRSEFAGANFERHFGVSAPQAELAPIEQALKQRSIVHQRLAVGFAYHSRWIDAARAPFESAMRASPMRNPALPLVCCDRADVVAQLPEDYFWNVVRRPIRFRETILQLERHGSYRYIDVGPSGTLATFVKYLLPPDSASTTHAVLTPFGQDQKHFTALVDAVARPAAIA